MKKVLNKYFLVLFLIFSFIACSVKKDKFINRNFHAVTTEYNVLYNGNLALDAGLEELVATYKDNFWEVLPVERMPDNEESLLPGQTKNPNFTRAEEKAVKAIQKHSMNISGTERNPQMDEAYLLLAKARYYDNRFIPSLEALNYILYKYPKSDKIYHAKVWREKVNIRIENNEVAIKNLKKLLEDDKIEKQDLADANAMLTQAYLNIEATDSAIATLKVAKQETQVKEEQARYSFILGQLYEKMNYQDSAYVAFQEVIDMKRKSPRRYVIQSHLRQAAQFDYEKGDTIAFLEKYKKLIEDRENRQFLDLLYYQKGLFYDNFKQDSLSKKFYNKSLRSGSQDQYLTASNYRNIGEIHFRNAEYKTAGIYYDSTLLRMDERTREYRKIKKKKDNLVDVIMFEDIAQQNDSILSVVAMSENEKIAFYERYIEKLKKEDELRAKLEAEKAEKEANIQANTTSVDFSQGTTRYAQDPNPLKTSSLMPPTGSDLPSQSNFYFYNPTTVGFGKNEFKKKWGTRKLGDNWRQSSNSDDFKNKDEENENEDVVDNEEKVEDNPAYKVDFYINQLPTEQKVIDSLAKDRNNAYYQLGVIYKEKFKEYKLAANRLETLLQNNPEERLILPAKYNLFKIYQIIDPLKANQYKDDIVANYPESRYAQIVQKSNALNEEDDPEKVFKQLYSKLSEGEIREVYKEVIQKVDEYFGDENLPKFELLKANVVARTNGLEAYKNALNFVALTYPNIIEGKQAQALLEKDVPKLEALTFTEEDNRSWKIIFPKVYNETLNYNALTKKLAKYIEDSHNEDLKLSVDVYNLENDFVVLHGFKSFESAKGILSYLREFKEYKIKDEAQVISSDNYKVIQVKKNYNEWLKKE